MAEITIKVEDNTPIKVTVKTKDPLGELLEDVMEDTEEEDGDK